MHHHWYDNALLWVVLVPLLAAVGFALSWYLLGVGVGIAHRGYNRLAPGPRVRRTTVPYPVASPRGPYANTWDS